MKRILNRIGSALLALTILTGLLTLALSVAPKVTYEYEPFSMEPVELPNSRLLALGTCTHGNAEPFKAAEWLLVQMLEQHGNAALILEENVGDAAFAGQLHSFCENGSWFGFTNVYRNQQAEDLLDFLADNGIRLYGNDVQMIERTCRLLAEGLSEYEHAAALKTLYDYDETPEKGLAIVEDAERYCAEIPDPAQKDWYLHLLNAVRQHYEFIGSDAQFDTRDRIMAENTLWAMNYEKTYYGNDHTLLFAHNGHACVNDHTIQKRGFECTTQGSHLEEALGEDYFVVLTDTNRSAFTASQGGMPYLIDRKRLDWPQERIVLMLVSEVENSGQEAWDFLWVGALWKHAWSHFPAQYTVSIPTECFDALLLFREMTPVSYLQ